MTFPAGDSYVALMAFNGDFIAVRGASAIGPWSYDEARYVGNRLQAEIGGKFHMPLLQVVWQNTHMTPPISAAEYIQIAAGDGGHTAMQYKNDPLVTGIQSEVQ